MPREVKSAACQQIVRLGSDIDLGELPLLVVVRRLSPAITSAAVFSAEPDSHRPVAGRFDLQQIDATRLAVCWAAHDEHARLLGDYRPGPENAAGRGHWRRSGVLAGRLRAAAAGRRRLCRGRLLRRSRSTWLLAAASISRCPPRPRSCSKAMSILGAAGYAGPFRTDAPRHAAACRAGDARDGHDAAGQSDLHRDGSGPAAARGLTVARAMQRVLLPLARRRCPSWSITTCPSSPRRGLGGRFDSQDLCRPRP